MIYINKTHRRTPNTQRNIILEMFVSMKISNTPYFTTPPNLFYQLLPFYGKNLNPPFWVNFKKSPLLNSNPLPL